MRADPLLLTAGEWLGIAGGVLLLLTMVGFLLLVTFVPQISLWLPRLLFGG